MTNHWNTIRKTISWDTTSHQLNGSVLAVFFWHCHLMCAYMISHVHACSHAIPWLQSIRLLCLWNFPGTNTGVCCHFLFQEIFLNQGWNPHLLHLLHWQVDALLLAVVGSYTNQMVIIKKSTNDKCWGGCEEKANFPHCRWGCKLVQVIYFQQYEGSSKTYKYSYHMIQQSDFWVYIWWQL